MSLQVLAISVSIAISIAVIMVLMQAKIGLLSDVRNFLVLGSDNIKTIQRELSYDNSIGYDYITKHLKEKFGFESLHVFDDGCYSPRSCLLSIPVLSAGHSIDLCLNLSTRYRLVKKLETINGPKFLVLKKEHNFISDTFLNFAFVALSAIFLFSLLFIWFYKELMKSAFYPFYNIYRVLNGEKEAQVDISVYEVRELYEAIVHRSAVERELAEVAKQAAVFRAVAATTQMVAHDVRRPIDMVKRFTRRLLTSPEDSMVAYAQQAAPKLEKAAMEVHRMLENLTDMSPGQTPLAKDLVNLHDFTRGIVADFDEEAIEVVVDGLLTARFDAMKIKRVLSNVLRNATEAARHPARFWMHVGSSERSIRFEVGNTGSRIDPEHLERIFETFYTAGKPSGKGLGMAIARKFVEDHGGEIWCESNGISLKSGDAKQGLDGDYVIFYIDLPISYEESANECPAE